MTFCGNCGAEAATAIFPNLHASSLMQLLCNSHATLMHPNPVLLHLPNSSPPFLFSYYSQLSHLSLAMPPFFRHPCQPHWLIRHEKTSESVNSVASLLQCAWFCLACLAVHSPIKWRDWHMPIGFLPPPDIGTEIQTCHVQSALGPVTDFHQLIFPQPAELPSSFTVRIERSHVREKA